MAGFLSEDARKAVYKLFGVDLRALAALRIALASILLVDLATRLPLVPYFYTDHGVWPRELAWQQLPSVSLSLHMLGGSGAFQIATFGLAALFALLLLVGFLTRTATVGSYLLALSSFQRVPLIVDGGDSLLVLLLLWGMFLPLGARYSVDAARRGESLGGGERLVSIASAGLLLQVAFVYFFAGILKLYGASWRDGSAVLFALGQDYWARPFGVWLRGAPALVALATYGTLLVELLAPLALFSPVRTGRFRLLGIAALLLFQITMGLSMELWLFPVISIAALIPFIPQRVWDRLDLKLGSWATSSASLVPTAADIGARRSSLSGNGARRRFGLRLREVLAGLALFVVFVSNLESWRGRGFLPGPVRALASSLGLAQGWGMYAPNPYAFNFWLRIAGTRADRSSVLIDDGDGSGRWSELDHFRRGYRPKVYIEWISDPARETELAGLGDWICRRWNASHGGSDRLVEVLFELIERRIGANDDGETFTTPLPTRRCDSLEPHQGRG